MAAAVGALVVPAAASAYSMPSGDSTSTSCLPWPADMTNTANVDQPQYIGNMQVSANSNGIAGPLGTAANMLGGPATLFFTNPSGATGTVDVNVLGQFTNRVASFPVGGSGPTTVSLGTLPPGQVKIVINNTSATAVTFVVGFWEQSDQSQTAIEQLQAMTALCDGQAGWWATQHGDEGAVKSAVQGLTANGTTLDTVNSSIKALTANGTTLDTLHGDLETLHNDLQTLNTTEASSTGGGSGTTQPVSFTNPVQLSPADRQMSADIANQLDGDLWIIVGVLVGCFATGFILNRVWPS